MGLIESTIIIYLVIGVSSWIIMALACAWLAGQKGRDKITWGLLGLLLGLLALILIAASPSKKEKQAS